MELFSSNLRKRVNDLGLTQAEAARRCGLENRRFHHYLRGDREPDLATLVLIARVLGTTPDVLLGAKRAPPVGRDQSSRLRAKLIAAADNMDPPALRLLTVLADGVVAFTRDGGAAAVQSQLGKAKRPKRRRR